MKTKKQIKNWLNDQRWKSEFLENFIDGEAYRKACESFSLVAWGYNENFIRSAFDFAKTANKAVWMNRAEAYEKWYSTEENPQSWEEFMKDSSGTVRAVTITAPRSLTEAFDAYGKLMALRSEWVLHECAESYDICSYKISTIYNELGLKPVVVNMEAETYGLSFPSREMAWKFVKTFKDLITKAQRIL